MKKTSFTFESWSALSDDIEIHIGTLTEQERKRMSGPWRVWELCVARANNWGHAAFRRGELARLACGEDTPANRDQVRRWLKILCQMGRIDPQHSTQLCVMVNRDIVQRNGGRGKREHMCFEESHADMPETPYSPKALDPAFTAPPWEPEPSEYDTLAVDSEPDLVTSAPSRPKRPTARQRIGQD